MGKKSGICIMLLALCLTLGGCGAQEEKRFIDMELWSNRDYFLWNQELSQMFLECPYDEVCLLSEGYGELERALEVFNAYELALYSEGNQELGFSFEELGNLIRSQNICGSEE